jgi:hypothetical protein
MQRWEYKVTLVQIGEFDFDEWDGERETKEAKIKMGWNEETSSWVDDEGQWEWLKFATDARLETYRQRAEDLNAEGHRGWELVSVVRQEIDKNSFLQYWKRPAE